MPFDVALVQRRLETVLPARRDEFEIALLEPAAATEYDGHPPVYVDSSGQLVAALSIKVFDLAPRRVVCSVTQQRVVLARPSDRDDARVVDYAVGWARALAHLAARCRELDTVAPRDLAYPEALDETAPRTEEDFYRVFTTRDDLLVVWAACPTCHAGPLGRGGTASLWTSSHRSTSTLSRAAGSTSSGSCRRAACSRSSSP